MASMAMAGTPTREKFSAHAASTRPANTRIGPGNTGNTVPAMPASTSTALATHNKPDNIGLSGYFTDLQ